MKDGDDADPAAAPPMFFATRPVKTEAVAGRFNEEKGGEEEEEREWEGEGEEESGGAGGKILPIAVLISSLSITAVDPLLF